jgi:hypothetical protein
VGVGWALGISAEEFENWMTPKQAVQFLDSVYGDDSGSFTSKHTLLEHIRGGVVKTVARTSTFSVRNKPIEFMDIPAYDWNHISENTIFWNTGHLGYRTVVDYQEVSVRRFDVRFEPNAVRAIIAPAAKQAEVAPPAAEPAPDEREPVSLASLRAWYAVYQSVYPDRSEDHAWRSAQGMFHDKSVSRSQIRKVRGDRPMGRPRGS